MGSGAIGTFVGAWLHRNGAAAGHQVVFLAREGGLFRTALALKQGLSLTDCDGTSLRIPIKEVRLVPSLPEDLDFDYVLVCGT